jgi:hypothetical protein
MNKIINIERQKKQYVEDLKTCAVYRIDVNVNNNISKMAESEDEHKTKIFKFILNVAYGIDCFNLKDKIRSILRQYNIKIVYDTDTTIIKKKTSFSMNKQEKIQLKEFAKQNNMSQVEVIEWSTMFVYELFKIATTEEKSFDEVINI